MRIAFNPSTVAALTTPPNNKDITFDLKGRNIFARGVKFQGTDTNTWRQIKINNVSIGTNILDLRNGINTTLTNTNGVVTINSTWRPVVDNLTSDSTTSSLSANQGRVLKALIDGKSDSGHNHDGRYVRYYAVTTLDCNNLAAGLTAARVSATNAAHTNNSVYLYISDIGTPFQIQIPDSNVPYIYKRYYSSGKWSGWFKLNAGYADSAGSVAWANITGKPSSYTPSAHTHAWNSLTHSSTTENQAILTNGKANGWKLYTLNISGWNNAANNAHSHANKSVLDGITSGLVSNWNTAYNFVNNITKADTDKVINKWDEIVNFLAGITEDNKLNTLLNSKLSVYELADKTNVGTIKNNGIYYSTTDASSGTLTNSPFNTGFALINMTSYDGGDDLRRSRLAFNAFGEIKVSDDKSQLNTAETWYNVLTSKNSGISGSTIKLNGTSITVYSSGTADGRYVKKSGDTMTGILTIDYANFGALIIKRSDDSNGASIQFRGKSNIYGHIGFNATSRNKQLLRWNDAGSQVYTILDTSSTYTSSGKGVINGTTITQVDNATNAMNSTNARKLVNWYSSRPTSLNAQFGDGSLRIFYATSSTTEGKPAEDSHILHLAWDNTGGWDAQLAVHTRSGKVSTRAQSSGTWQPWKTLAFTTDIPSSLKNPHSFNVFGVTYDGSAAKTVTTSTFISQVNEAASTITDGTMLITSYASNSGFADTNAVNIPYKRKAVHLWEYIKTKTDSLYTVIGHTHDDRYLRLIGGTMTGTINRRSGGSTISGRDHAIIRQTYAPGGSSWNPIACVDTETGTWTLGHLSSGDSDTNFHFCFSTNADYNAGNNNGNYVTLRNRAGTIALTSEIPNKNSWNYDDRYYTKAESNAKYITDISTSVNKLTFTKNGSNIDRTITVNNVQSLGRRSPLTERNAISGIYTYGTYSKENNLAPTNYFETLGFGEGTAGAIEIGGSWISGGQLYWRALRDCCENWFSWKTILDSSNYSDILDSRYYTESEVNSLLSNKLNTSDFNWTNLPGKIVAGNEFNIVNAGFKESMWFNYLPINDRNKTATISSYHFGNGAKGYASVQASGFIKSGGNVSQLLRADGGVAAFNWSGQSGQPTWLWGGNSQHSYYVYNPSNFRVAYAASAGNADTLDGEHANSFVRAGAIDTDKTDLNALDTYSFIKSVNSEVADHSPKRNTGWYNVIQLVHRNGSGDGPGYIGQIALGMTTNTDDMFFRGKRTDSWKTVIHSGNISSQTVASATKLQTARNIALGTDLRGSANFDGSSNITINANINACTVSVGSTDTLPFKRIAHFETGRSWNDNALLLYISQGYINGSNGICRVEFRTDNISSSNSNPRASSSVRWLVRNGYNLDSLYAGYYVTTGKAYIDIYLKTTGAYQGTVIRVLQDSRGGINSNVQLINSHYYSDTNHKEAYNSVEAASTALYNRAYTRIVSGSDVGTVSHANSAGSVNWNNITGKPSSLPANGGNADTVDGVHMDWSTNYTEGNYLAIWDNKGNCIRPIPKGSTSVGYASSAGNASTLGGTSLGGLFTAFGNNAHNITATIGGVTKSFLVNWAADSDKLDGKHASDFATAGHNHDGRYVKIWGNVEANFNFPDGEGHSGVYMCHTTKTQSNKPETYGLLTDFSTVNGHLQFFGASSNKIYTRTYWWTGQNNFKYTDWHTLLHTGNSSVSGQTITINGTSTTWSNTWRPLGTGSGDAAAGNHTHKVKINGSEKTIAATGVTDLGTYLTSQSLRGYVHAYNNTGTGNAVTSISIEGGTITANKGTTFLTSHQSLANYYTKGQVDAKLGKYLPLAGGTMDAGAQIQRTAKGGMWYQGRSIALLRETSANGYHALWSLKTTDGSWDFGEYNSSGWNNIPVLSYVLDSNFDKSSNATTYQIKFPLASGTIALTSNIPNPTDYYWANNKITSSSKIDAQVRVSSLGAGCLTTIANTVMATNWLRATGSTGIYFQDHAGGLYMSDDTWIRTYNSKALQVDNTIRSKDFNTTYIDSNSKWTITSAAKLENSTTLVYGSSTISNGIKSYLRGTTVSIQVRTGTSANYSALYLTSDHIYCNNYCDMKYGAAVSGGSFTVQNKMSAGGYVHSGHNSDDAMLLAGGGWKKLNTLVEYPSDESFRLVKKESNAYELRFVKLVNFNNLIYVDGWIKPAAHGKSFTLDAKFKPYLYNNDRDLLTVIQMGDYDIITINGDGHVSIYTANGGNRRIGFFYTGRA